MPKFAYRLVRFLAAVGIAGGLIVRLAGPAHASSAINGAGSSFAGIEMQQWTADVAAPQYGLSVNYQSSSSGQGRQLFFDGSVDFAVSDIRYDSLDDGTNIPDPNSFAYIPVTAGGIAFMYNLQKEGFTQSAPPIKLSPVTICAMFGDQISYWDDSHIAADNPGVHLPHVKITPVVRSDAGGTNYVLEEYCIATEPAIFKNFIDAWNNSPQVKGGGGQAVPDNQPTSFWPLLQPIQGATGSDGVADQVAQNDDDGFIGAVETGYAIQRHFPYTAVQNDTGAYVQPTPAAVASALGHATQLDDGTQQLKFTPNDPAAYNPSTYSYMLVRRTGRSTSIGATVSAFGNYSLTIGQKEAPTLGYATINRSLIQYGLQRLQQAVPGAVPPTSAEQAAIPADNSNTNPTSNPGTVGTTPTTGGSTTSSPGATDPSGSSGGSGGGSAASPDALTGASTGSGGGGSTGSAGGSAATGGTATAFRATGAVGGSGGGAGSGGGITGSGGGGTGGSAALASLDPSASLGAPTNGPLGQTGVESDILLGLGGVLLLVGEWSRRRIVGQRSST